MLKITTKKFDPANWPEGTWATFSEGAEFKIRKINSDIIRGLRKPLVTVKMEFNTDTRMTEEVEKFDPVEWADTLAGYVLEDFKGCGDDEGNPLPVNLASKKAIMNYPQLREFILSIAQAIDVITARRQEAEIKN